MSLATDSATEAVYPLLPFFLTRVLGAGAVSLGILEGAAEAVNSILKVASGRLADRTRRKRPLVLLGYGVSSMIRPFIAIATTWTQVFLVRVLDRVGKGVRSAPRDAMLAAWTTPTTRGKVYGFHRSMDHAGAGVVVPALTIVPGAIAVALILLVHERSDDGDSPAEREARRRSMEIHPSEGGLPREFTAFMLVLTLFTFGNSTDAFLLLKLTDVAGTPRFVPLMWAALHVVKATVSVVGGSWSDRIGRRTVIAAGWLVYAVVYAGFAISHELPALFAWFLLYGFYFGFAEGTERALVADLTPAGRRGFAFGVYNAVQGLGGLVASVVFGLVWSLYGATAAFGLGATLALAATAALFLAVPKTQAV